MWILSRRSDVFVDNLVTYRIIWIFPDRLCVMDSVSAYYSVWILPDRLLW